MRPDPADGPTVAELLAAALTPAEQTRLYALLAALVESAARAPVEPSAPPEEAAS